MNIAALAPQPTATIAFLHPATGEPLITSDGREMFAVCYGHDTRQYKAALASMYRKQLELAKGSEDWKPTEDEQREILAPVFEAVIESILYEDADGIQTDVARFAADPDMQFYRDELDTKIRARENFMQA